MVEGVPSQYPIEVVWEGGRRYRGGAPGGATLLLDGEREAAPGPVDAMLIALGSCAAIDVVEILEKRRTPVRHLTMRVEFSRAPTAPRRLTEVRVHYRISTESELPHVERAVALSFEKYCSVSNSLAPDTNIEWAVELVPESEVGG